MAKPKKGTIALFTLFLCDLLGILKAKTLKDMRECVVRVSKSILTILANVDIPRKELAPLIEDLLRLESHSDSEDFQKQVAQAIHELRRHLT